MTKPLAKIDMTDRSIWKPESDLPEVEDITDIEDLDVGEFDDWEMGDLGIPGWLFIISMTGVAVAVFVGVLWIIVALMTSLGVLP